MRLIMSWFDGRKPKMTLDEKYVAAEEVLGVCGRMLSGSKTVYRNRYPDNVVIFNANICTKAGKIWFGDTDVTLDEPKLKALAAALGEKIYVLREMDGRFDSEANPKLDLAVASF